MLEAMIEIILTQAYRVFSYVHPNQKMSHTDFNLSIQCGLLDPAQNPYIRGMEPQAQMGAVLDREDQEVQETPMLCKIPWARRDNPRAVGRKRCVVCRDGAGQGGWHTRYLCQACRAPICGPETRNCLDLHFSGVNQYKRRKFSKCTGTAEGPVTLEI